MATLRMAKIYYRDNFYPVFGDKELIDWAVKNQDRYKYIATLDCKSVGETFGLMNVVNGDELPTLIKCRSMCVGDIVSMDGKFHICLGCGWGVLPDLPGLHP